MTSSLFDMIKSLYLKLNVNNLDVHNTRQELSALVFLGRKNDKLRIITRFLCILDVLSYNYEYDDAYIITNIKDITKRSLDIILSMVDGTISNKEGTKKMNQLIQDSRFLLVAKLGEDPFLYDINLLEQLAYDLKKDVEHIQDIFKTPRLLGNNKQSYDTVRYYLNQCYENVNFIGISDFINIINTLSLFVDREFKNGHFSEIGSQADFLLALEYLNNRIEFLHNNAHNKDGIINHLQDNNPNKLIERLKKDPFQIRNPEAALNFSNIILTNDEISALMDNEHDFEIISFDQVSEKPVIDPLIKQNETDSVAINLEEYLRVTNNNSLPINPLQNNVFNVEEDVLIKYIGRLFQKQEQLKSWLSTETMIDRRDDLKEIDTITQGIKEMLFDQYYISVENLMGKELRDYIHSEVSQLGKKIRLGIRGEKSEMLTRESEFIKHIVFTLVKNSLHYSLEPVFRRRALDKSEACWLLIEFEDAGDHFDIYIRDDGRGVIPDLMNIIDLQDQVINRGGFLEVDSMENEYLKIHVQLPMKKILTDCLVVRIHDTTILLPNRCVNHILEPKDIAIALRDENCLGQVNLASVLGFGKAPMNMFIVFVFGIHKILFGVDNVLDNIETLVENADVPLIACSSGVAILKDGSLGFIINEKALYDASKSLINKREQITLSNTIF